MHLKKLFETTFPSWRVFAAYAKPPLKSAPAYCGKLYIPVIVCCIDLTHMGVYKEVQDLGDKKPNNLVHKKV
jgi:hypothetical protein